MLPYLWITCCHSSLVTLEQADDTMTQKSSCDRSFTDDAWNILHLLMVTLESERMELKSLIRVSLFCLSERYSPQCIDHFQKMVDMSVYKGRQKWRCGATPTSACEEYISV